MSATRVVPITVLQSSAKMPHKQPIDALLGKVIGVEGLIGSGKSTLSRKLEVRHQGKVNVYVEQVNEGFLKMFYDDPERYAWALQWGQLKLRLYQLELAMRDAGTPRLSIWDRSMIGDYIFCLLNHLMGTISDEEMAVYESEFGCSIEDFAKSRFFEHVDALVLLDDEPAACKRRAELRGNESESDIPLSYYEGLDQLHFAVFLRLFSDTDITVGVLRWGDYHEAEELLRHFASIVQSPAGRVVYTDSPEPDLSDYSSAELVRAKYEAISSGGSPALLEYRKRRVAFKRDIMTIDESLLGVRANKYNLTFYENAYRRVVLHYLRAGATVEFY